MTKLKSPYKNIINLVEIKLIKDALKKTKGNQVKAALILGIHRNTIRNKIKRFGFNLVKWKKYHD